MMTAESQPLTSVCLLVCLLVGFTWAGSNTAVHPAALQPLPRSLYKEKLHVCLYDVLAGLYVYVNGSACQLCWGTRLPLCGVVDRCL